MKKKIVGILLLAFIFITVNANTLTKQKVELETWKSSTRAPVQIPISAFIEENSFILIKFFEHQSQFVTFQIKDSHGNIIFQDIVMSDEDYKIDLSKFKKGQYELFYLDEQIVINGKFYIE